MYPCELVLHLLLLLQFRELMQLAAPPHLSSPPPTGILGCSRPIVHFPVRKRPASSSPALSSLSALYQEEEDGFTQYKLASSSKNSSDFISDSLQQKSTLFGLFVILSLVSPLVARVVLSSSLPFSGLCPSSQDNSQCNSLSKILITQKKFFDFTRCVYGPPSPLF